MSTATSLWEKIWVRLCTCVCVWCDHSNLTRIIAIADMGGIANSYRAYQAKLQSDPQFAAQEAMVRCAVSSACARI
jgi:hypothetical protein